MGPNGWNVMEQVTGHPGGDFGTAESVSEREVSQILSPERPKRANMVQRWPKSDLEHSGGPKRLEWHGISYRTSWLRFWHSWECVWAGGVPNFGPGATQKGQNGPIMPKNGQHLTMTTLVVPNGWNGME